MTTKSGDFKDEGELKIPNAGSEAWIPNVHCEIITLPFSIFPLYHTYYCAIFPPNVLSYIVLDYLLTKCVHAAHHEIGIIVDSALIMLQDNLIRIRVSVVSIFIK